MLSFSGVPNAKYQACHDGIAASVKDCQADPGILGEFYGVVEESCLIVIRRLDDHVHLGSVIEGRKIDNLSPILGDCKSSHTDVDDALSNLRYHAIKAPIGLSVLKENMCKKRIP